MTEEQGQVVWRPGEDGRGKGGLRTVEGTTWMGQGPALTRPRVSGRHLLPRDVADHYPTASGRSRGPRLAEDSASHKQLLLICCWVVLVPTTHLQALEGPRASAPGLCIHPQSSPLENTKPAFATTLTTPLDKQQQKRGGVRGRGKRIRKLSRLP